MVCNTKLPKRSKQNLYIVCEDVVSVKKQFKLGGDLAWTVFIFGANHMICNTKLPKRSKQNLYIVCEDVVSVKSGSS